MAIVVVALEDVTYKRYFLPLYALTDAATYILVMRIVYAIRHYDNELFKTIVGKRWAYDMTISL